MRVTQVRVEVKKMFSDGNYGHQSAEVVYSAEVDYNEDAEAVTSVLLARASAQIAVELGASQTINIRRAAKPRPHVCNHCEQPLGDWESYTHPACEEKARAERDAKREEERARWAEQNGRELVGVTAAAESHDDYSGDDGEAEAEHSDDF